MKVRDFMPNIFRTSVTSFINSLNTLTDCSFYDTEALTAKEFDYLAQKHTQEGAILVVHPSNAKAMGIVKYDDHKEFSENQDNNVHHYTIAGVGSSDVGAAALARNFADHYGQPVGAIVAGYGISDLLTEALGGWFALGKENRVLASDKQNKKKKNPKNKEKTKKLVAQSPDTQTLFKLLLDPDHSIKSLGGHSKGCLSIALALKALFEQGNKERLDRAKDINIITLGTVVELPEGFDRLYQFIGNIDWFGGINSRADLDKKLIHNAWHHLNTSMPMHMNVRKVLSENNL